VGTRKRDTAVTIKAFAAIERDVEFVGSTEIRRRRNHRMRGGRITQE
jgi:hypothetical protein